MYTYMTIQFTLTRRFNSTIPFNSTIELNATCSKSANKRNAHPDSYKRSAAPHLRTDLPILNM